MKARFLFVVSIAALLHSIAFGAPSSSRGDAISVDFPDEERSVILRNVADVFELNLVLPGNLPGRTSLKLRDKDWKSIFALVLSPIGYSWKEEAGTVVVFDAVPEARIAPAAATPITPDPVPNTQVEPLNWTSWSLVVVASVTAIATLLVMIFVKPRPLSDDSTRLLAGFIRILALTYLLEVFSSFGTLSTYISIYARFAESGGMKVGLSGLVATGFVMVLHLALGIIGWRIAPHVATWIFRSLGGILEVKRESAPPL